MLFIKQLERQDAEHVQDGKQSIYESETDPKRWSQLYKLDDPYGALTGEIFPWLRTLGKTIKERWGEAEDDGLEVAEYLEDAFFQLPKEKTATLKLALKSVNDLFDNSGSQNADLMGDIFEYLLNQLSTSGKNGQFRTPRHIIRFMIEMVDPKEGSKIIDPAGGTAGFLTNAILHYRKERTPKEQLRLEWDGTPHNLGNGYKPKPDEFNGFDNDRTMVRIGWMNMILHGIAHPNYEQRDPLSKALPDSESNKYDYAFANPPYSGSVDKDDLHKTRFPHTKPKGKNKETTPLTDSSELLFVWLLLDLLKPGGRMAIIVPEGLLFGSTTAHRDLRRTLLLEHVVEGVISLPQGVFNPYTGVKTSILIVKKVKSSKINESNVEEARQITEPETKSVWFYEVASDGFTLGANRNPQPLKDNDLWDALEKWKQRGEPTANEKGEVYYQPEIRVERWRAVDTILKNIFPEVSVSDGRVLAVYELFPDVFAKPFNLLQAEKSLLEESAPLLPELVERTFAQQTFAKNGYDPAEVTKDQLRQTLNRLRNLLLNHAKDTLEQREGAGSYLEEHGRNLLSQAIEQLSPREDEAENSNSLIEKLLSNLTKERLKELLDARPLTHEETLPLIKLFARLDGFDIYLRSVDVRAKPEPLTEPKCWTIPVRQWRVRPEWVQPEPEEPTTGKGKKGQKTKPVQAATSKVRGSHDKNGKVRPEYEAAAFNPKTGLIDPDYLDPECIEANDFNLSAGRYKPLQASSEVVEAGATAKLLKELLETEAKIRKELEILLELVEGKA